ncbi:MAG: glutathione S-transferase family protein [Sulfitobacter sp.]
MTLEIHGSALSPFTRKVTLLAMELGMNFKSIELIPYMAPKAFSEISPLRKIPVLQDDGFTLNDSSAICAYLKLCARPTQNLMREDPKKVGKTLWVEEYADTAVFDVVSKGFFQPLMVNRLFGKPLDFERVARAKEEELPPCFDYLERYLAEDEWFCGGEFSLADISVYAQMVNLKHTQHLPTASQYPNLMRHFDQMMGRKTVAELFQTEVTYLQKMLTAYS